MIKLLAALALVTACPSNPKPTPMPDRGNPGSVASHASCSADADCVVVETQCCDHCNGGKAEAFNQAFADQHKATGCEQTMCTQMACGPAIAKCDSGTCRVELGEL